MHNAARQKQGKSLAEKREFKRFFQGKVPDKKQTPVRSPAVMHGNTVKQWQYTALLHTKISPFWTDIKVREFTVRCIMNPP